MFAKKTPDKILYVYIFGEVLRQVKKTHAPEARGMPQERD
jgi:hypothetical protein